jgi:hypothetical protein
MKAGRAICHGAAENFAQRNGLHIARDARCIAATACALRSVIGSFAAHHARDRRRTDT